MLPATHTGRTRTHDRSGARPRRAPGQPMGLEDARRPASTSAIASLTSSSGRVSRVTSALPAACNSKTSRRSVRAHSSRPRDAVENGLEDGQGHVVLAGSAEDERPAAAERAVGLLERLGRNPWRSPDRRRPAWMATGSSVAAFTMNSAPSSRASSSFSSCRSTATTRPPAMRAYWIAMWPSPDAEHCDRCQTSASRRP